MLPASSTARFVVSVWASVVMYSTAVGLGFSGLALSSFTKPDPSIV